MHLKYDGDFHILVYKSLTSKGTENVKNVKWSEWCKFLTQPEISATDKYKNGLAIYGDVDEGVDEKTGEMLPHRRLEKHVLYREVFSLDYDDIENMDAFITNVKMKLQHFAYFIYTTYRHRDKPDKTDKGLKPRFRVLVPIDDILTPEEYESFSRALAQYIGEPIDESCYQPIQLSALPTIKNEQVPFHWYNNDAPFISRKDLELCYQKYQPKESISVNYSHINGIKRRDSAHWQNLAFGVDDGQRNDSLASLIGYLLRRYVDPTLVYGLALAWNETCNPPLSQARVNTTFNSIYQKYTGQR
ncbi:primase alpha helix C-terminal domain-containing protein [Staphylococcus sp. Marseille-Q6910]|uniref:primase alpha helix C-terminal domain-containing protein n=1 Tax=Staphylococcus sp. Marseille-Q6910 TaxID=2937990 RepID=UPI00203A4153|nr:primase alpha helix C-terminal domain-containing protein [Staphylococcus sp. Marseille-Q6910]